MKRLRIWFCRRFLRLAIDRDEADTARCMRMARRIEKAERYYRGQG